jgi:hypothetical protein
MSIRRTIIAGLLVSLPAGAEAQLQGDGFMFRPPTGSFSIRGGYSAPSAKSDIFAFLTEHHTLSRRDFSGGIVEADLAFRLADRAELVWSAGYSATNKLSEFRHWEDNNDQPIEQRVRFERVPMTANLRYYVTPRGRSVGTFAWLPNRFAVYVGGGGGLGWYRFRQEGDFIDFETTEVFPHKYESEGFSLVKQLFAGSEVTVGSRVALNTQARYGWSSGDLGIDWIGFDRIDLSGLSVTAGISLRY